MKITRLLIATRNVHKVSELKAMLGNSVEVKSLRDFPDAPTPIEDASTFAGNATKKAVTLANWLATNDHANFWVLADDSGLEVDPLAGAPGVHSARFAALDTGAPGNSKDSDNNAKLLRLLKEKASPWKARFRCALALTPVPDPQTNTNSPVCLTNEAEFATRIFEGACEGQIVPIAQGREGFGYDPHFVPDGFSQTFAELGEETKNRISHRARAMAKLLAEIGNLR